MVDFLWMHRRADGKRDWTLLLFDIGILAGGLIFMAFLFIHLGTAVHQKFLMGLITLAVVMLVSGLLRTRREERPKASLWLLFFVLLTVPSVWGFPSFVQVVSMVMALILLWFLVARRIKFLSPYP